MDTGYYKFYRSKKRALLGFLPVVAFGIMTVINPDVWISGFFALILFLFWMVKMFIPLIKHQPYIEITPSYIKVNDWDRLLWAEIDRVEKVIRNVNGRTLIVYNFWPKDISKYHLTLIQKGNMKMKFSPFSLMLPGPLQEDDCVKLVEILKEKVPNNNLD
ncbi:MAG: hypothetical protein IKS41_04655 [Alphaproteobacteria bacterium]|nr:hypothetical protein [Alphaproteobacteria bacterium]